MRCLGRLRVAAAALPGAREALTFGNPAFRVGGKAFAVIDHYQGSDCLWLRVEPALRAELLARRGWFPSPYDPKKAAACCAVEAFDWRRLAPLLRASYRLARGR